MGRTWLGLPSHRAYQLRVLSTAGIHKRTVNKDQKKDAYNQGTKGLRYERVRELKASKIHGTRARRQLKPQPSQPGPYSSTLTSSCTTGNLIPTQWTLQPTCPSTVHVKFSTPPSKKPSLRTNGAATGGIVHPPEDTLRAESTWALEVGSVEEANPGSRGTMSII